VRATRKGQMQSGRGPDWRGIRKVELRSESTGLVVAWWLTSISLVLLDQITFRMSSHMHRRRCFHQWWNEARVGSTRKGQIDKEGYGACRVGGDPTGGVDKVEGCPRANLHAAFACCL